VVRSLYRIELGRHRNFTLPVDEVWDLYWSLRLSWQIEHIRETILSCKYVFGQMSSLFRLGSRIRVNKFFWAHLWFTMIGWIKPIKYIYREKPIVSGQTNRKHPRLRTLRGQSDCDVILAGNTYWASIEKSRAS
jgi:hypothetical protein